MPKICLGSETLCYHRTVTSETDSATKNIPGDLAGNTTGTSRLRILLCSHWFQPSVGGVESISRVLAEEFVRLGAEVTVLTATPGDVGSEPYRVVRRASQRQIWALARASDVVLQNMISLRTLAPIVLSGRPVIVIHQSWMRRSDGSSGIENLLKRLATRFCHNVAISKAIAAAIPAPSVVIGNPFDAREFKDLVSSPRDQDIVFLGRLVSDKGCDLLLEAFGVLATRGLRPSLTVIGDGDERSRLETISKRLGLESQVTFLGAIQDGRGKVVARHRIMAVPSRWAEPFGVVALEGIASGCAIVASSGGGLPDAVGPCGLFFTNGDATGLADALERLLRDDALRKMMVSAGPMHLQAFHPDAIAQQYMDLIHQVIAG
jgi:glycosyltransferase involved in cell wall biosynthesis